jgi:signal peptidase I
MDDAHDQDTFTRPRIQPAQPLGRPGPQGTWSPAGEEPDAGPGDPGWQAPGPQPGPPPEDQDAPDERASAPSGKRRRHFWRELLVIVVVAAALTLVVKAFVAQVYKIPTGSMENTLQVNDRVLVNKLVYHFRGVARGDIVVFSGQDSWGPDAPPPSNNGFVRLWDDVLSGVGLQSSQTYYIKRVIGLPGDKVACCTDGKVTVNGVPLTETSYLYSGAPSFPFKTVTVPPGHLWVMGDHRGDSDDSRYHTGDPGGGAIPENEVVGRAFLIIWPLSRISDLPIPNTLEQAGLNAAAAAPPVTVAGGGALAGAAALTWRRRKSGSGRKPGTDRRRDRER